MAVRLQEDCQRIYRGVAQLVAYEVWDHGAAGSSPVTSTSREPRHALSRTRFFSILYFCSRVRVLHVINTRTNERVTGFGTFQIGVTRFFFVKRKNKAHVFAYGNTCLLLYIITHLFDLNNIRFLRQTGFYSPEICVVFGCFSNQYTSFN